MPGTDVYKSIAMTESPVLGSLKAHKVLPRKEKHAPQFKSLSKHLEESGDRKRKNRATFVTDEGIRSWIPDPDLRASLPVVVQPLTPPINIRDTFKSWMDDDALRNLNFSRKSDSPGTTPLVQRSPPTPETTPPRKRHTRILSDPVPVSQISTDRLTDISRHQTESRTDSFKTAREDLSSDDEFPSKESPSLNPSRQRWLKDTSLSNRGGIGLGLGLESDDENFSSPLGNDDRNLTVDHEDFIAFNGAWGSEATIANDDAQSHTTALKVSDDRDSKTTSRASTGHAQTDSPTLGSTPPKPNVLSSQLPSTSGKPRDSTWSNSDLRVRKTRDIDIELHRVSNKRLSQVSTASNVVEAVVIDNTPQRRRTLRHTGRISGGVSFPRNAKSMRSDQEQVQHELRNLKSPARGLRRTSRDDDSKKRLSEPATLGPGKTVKPNIPDRRASLQSSVTSSKRFSRTFSVSSQPQSSRPTTAPEGTAGYFDVPRQERNKIPKIEEPASLSKDALKAEKVLSSPATASHSPAEVMKIPRLSSQNSTTSGGLMTHYIPPTPSSLGSDTPRLNNDYEGPNVAMQRSHSGDWTTFRPQSNIVTPFSLRSAHSSTPGTLEVNEATAVNIYPHTNESILVIQQMASLENHSPRGRTMLSASESVGLSRPLTLAQMPHRQEPSPVRRRLVESPLQNPRDAPVPPPGLAIIPPTPANAASSCDEITKHTRQAKRASVLSTPITSLRRAVSARRHSETVKPFIRSLSLRGPSARRSPGTADDRGSRLHPTWRPRSFWEVPRGDEDTDSEFGNEGVLSPQRSSSYHSTPRRTMSLTRRLTNSFKNNNSYLQSQRASVALPTRRSPSAGPASTGPDIAPRRQSSLVRRLGGSLRLSPSSRRRRYSTADRSDQPDYEFVRDGDEDHNDVPLQGYPVHFVGFRGLAERLERRRETREEGRREERRNWLRGRIGLVEPKDVNAFDNVHPYSVRPVADN